MAIRTRTLIRLTFIGALIAWLVFTITEMTVLFEIQNKLSTVIFWVPKVAFVVYVLVVHFHFKLRIERNDNLSFTDLLWRIFAVGLISTVLSLGVRLLVSTLGTSVLVSNVFFSLLILDINLALIINLVMAGTVSLKRLIMYQKTKWLVRLWGLFEVFLLAALIVTSFKWSLPENSSYYIFGIGLVIILMLSTNVRWVAYLNVKQKWTALLLLLLTFFYVIYFSYSVIQYGSTFNASVQESSLSTNYLFVVLVVTFVAVYGVFSFLVILFNLPTSSVFEQKMEETLNFQRISQSIQTEQSEESVYNILLESAVSTVFADAAWLEIKDQKGSMSTFTFHIQPDELKRISDQLAQLRSEYSADQWMDKLSASVERKSLKGTRFRSILSLPIEVKGMSDGRLTLLKELPKGFNKEMTKIVKSFTVQAGISIENFRLLEEAFQNERYKEELKIAKEVQKSLLPRQLAQDDHYVMSAFSQSADEVGGDYYDTIRIDKEKVAWIIADVSGKGTTAAFYMSQMKGIFQCVAQLKFDPKRFMTTANLGLMNCLERGSFISAAYFVLDTKEKKITYARAGHCPILYFNTQTGETGYFQDKGTALGMVRNASFEQTVHTYSIRYHQGDVMVLYTDGIIETFSPKGEEFGYDRLAEVVKKTAHLTPKEIEKEILDCLYKFSGTSDLNDDYTTMIIKFN